MISRQYRLTGVTPLMMHNVRLADALDPFAIELKKVSSVRLKTEVHFKKMARIEFEGGLYIDHRSGKIGIPASAIRATIVNGAKKQKRGPQAKAAITPLEPHFAINYDGPSDIDELYADKRFVDRDMVQVSGSRVPRVRPIFPKWSVDIGVLTDESIFPVDHLDEAVIVAGEVSGLLEKRQHGLGRYTTEILA